MNSEKEMEFIKTDIEGVVILKPRVFEDARGYFYESFSQREFDENVAPVRFVQDNQSRSSSRVIRGLHFQKPPYAQAKLVRCTLGCVVDVAVDLRSGSPTFGRHVAVELSEANKLQLFIPKGFAHGFAVLSPEAVFEYKCDEYYAPQSEGGISILSPELEIEWPVCLADANLSPKDLQLPLWKDFVTPF